MSQRLKAAAKVYRNGAYEESDNQQSFTKPKRALSTIRSGAYDSYTNADGIIHNYVSQYFDNNKISEDIVTDDPIVRIIPKELCFILGEHFYIGKEYGFFIKVVQDRLIPTDYAADVLVFDIQHTVPSFPSNVTGATKIRPLFQYRYRASDKEKGGVWTGVDPNLTKIVVAHVEYDYAEYYIQVR